MRYTFLASPKFNKTTPVNHSTNNLQLMWKNFKFTKDCSVGKERKEKRGGQNRIKMLLFPDEDDVEELDGANDGESVGEAQHAANVGDEGGHAVRLHRILFNRGVLFNFFSMYCINTASSAALQIPLVGGCRNRTQDCCDFGIGRQTL
jgi:hypothetical protein